MNRNIMLITFLALLLAGFFGWTYWQEQQIAQNPACTQEAMICPDGTPVGRQGPNCEFAPCPQAPQQNITIESPAENGEVGLPLVIRGTARVFENVLNYRLKDEYGKILVQGIAVADAADIGLYGPYEVKVNFPEPRSQSGLIEVFSYSAKDGSEINLVQRNIRFQTVESQMVSVFFANQFRDPDVLDCTNVYPVRRRIARTEAVARAALEELLAGVTLDDINQGYVSNINTGVRLNSLVIDADGTARADFNDLLQAGVAGSCRVQFIRSQIERTLKQFPTVKNVIISIDGLSEEILQP